MSSIEPKSEASTESKLDKKKLVEIEKRQRRESEMRDPRKADETVL